MSESSADSRPSPRVLIVEDHPETSEFLGRSVEYLGFKAVHAETEEEAVARARDSAPVAVVLDWALREGDGLSVLRRLRAFSRVPVLMLSARGNTRDKVVALEAGADDYIAKPFDAEELMARIRAVLRRNEGSPDLTRRVLELPGYGLRMDIESREVTLRERRVSLTPKEFRLLQYLVERAGQTVPREELRRLLFASDDPHHDSAMDTHVSRLRRKVETDESAPPFISTIYGQGYRVDDLMIRDPAAG